MKRRSLLALALLLLTLAAARSQNALAQYLPVSGGEVIYTRVNELREMQLVDHMSAASRWLSDYRFPFNRAEEVDPDREILHGNGSIQVLWGPNSFDQFLKTIRFRIELVIKNDRYQYRLDQFVVSDGNRESQLEIYQSDTRLGSRYNPAFYKALDQKVDLMIRDLEVRMSQN